MPRSRSRTRKISIHALRKESDHCHRQGRTYPLISIHALRKESDGTSIFSHCSPSNFNPRSP